jgi:S1-C subfamily serine protease
MRLTALIATAVVGLVAAGCGNGSNEAATSVVTVTKTTTSAAAPAPAAPASGGNGTADVVARVLPGVVNVKTAGFDGSKGEASGVVIDRSGIIVTNYHVVRGARVLTVSFNDGRHKKAVKATVIGTAANRDLAIIRVALSDLIAVPLGHSSKLRLGDSVLAIGFPLDLGGGPTVTQGIVSGLDRTVHADDGPDLEGLLQTDAAINPGNSGGALVNAAGQLIGINTIAATDAENIGFAIAIDGARSVIDELRSKPAGSQAWIGVTFDSIDSSAAAVQIGLQPDARGAAVVAVFADSPASKAGLREGDVVVAVNGKAVRSAGEMSKALTSHKPGDSLVLDVVDQSGPRRATVKVVKRPATLPGG